ncbi:unnamed protein product [Schistosoma mattheei]|uniref:Uncharacterized protein n=1 Tax=Schistosoma mattheei TaxID=31246 RepID=A0A3P8E3J5_9TREM|nr:unnamed protein product [Schistosoma mattheei]
MDLGFVLLGTRQQGVPVILKEVVFTVRDVNTELSGPRPTSCRTEI